MKPFLRIFPLALLVVALSSCSGGGKPASVAKSFFDAMDSGDSEKAISLFAPELREDETMSGKLGFIVGAGISEVEEKGGVASFEVLEETVEGDQATINFKVVYGDGEQNSDEMKCVKVDGKWYLTLE